MQKQILRVLHVGALLDLQDNQLQVLWQGRQLSLHRLETIETLEIGAGVTLDGQARDALLRRGIDLVLLARDGRYRGRLASPVGRASRLTGLQLDRFTDPVFSLRLAQAVVAGKLTNQRRLLLRIRRERGAEEMDPGLAAMERAHALALASSDPEELRGAEGLGSAIYFDLYGLGIANPLFCFSGRNRRPPRDPVNAMLSYGYALLLSSVRSALLRQGLDPEIGFFHTPGRNRPSLALDLMEEFRPLFIDSLVLRLINLRSVAPDGFRLAEQESDETPKTTLKRGIYMDTPARKSFTQAWIASLERTRRYPAQDRPMSNREAIEAQVASLIECLLSDKQGYEPLTPA